MVGDAQGVLLSLRCVGDRAAARRVGSGRDVGSARISSDANIRAFQIGVETSTKVRPFE